ncbi:MAG: conjugal transfer protein MobA [Bacteroidota bacterium]
MEEKHRKQNKGGRKPKPNPKMNRYVFRLTDEENAKFLSLFDQSGVDNKAKFIVSLLFGKEMKSVKIDKGTVDFYMRLTSFHSQFRSIGVNYNQIVKLLYRDFSEKKAAAFLYKLEKQTAEMAMLCQKIIRISEEFETKYLKNSLRNDSKDWQKRKSVRCIGV